MIRPRDPEILSSGGSGDAEKSATPTEPGGTAQPADRQAATPRKPLPAPGRLAPGAAGLVAVLGHLPVLGAYWNQDDWGLLARAAKMAPAGLPAARLVSQDLYWRLWFPAAGLATQPYAWSRLLLHGGCAYLVARIAARAGLGPLAQWLAGLLFAASAFAFTPLYSASGIQELLGAFFALAALERWLASQNQGLDASDHTPEMVAGNPELREQAPPQASWNLVAVLGLGILSILAKENGLGLPVLLAALAWNARRRGQQLSRFVWPVITLLAVVAVAEAWLIWNHFDHTANRPYGLGGWSTPLTNLAGYGWWLVSPGPFHVPDPDPLRGAAGGLVWALWTVAALVTWQRGQRWVAACLLGTLLSVAPILVLVRHIAPYYLYLPWAGAGLALVSLLPRRIGLRRSVALGLVICALTWSWLSTTARLRARNSAGQPADPLVLKTAISFEAMQKIAAVPWNQVTPGQRHLILLQVQPPGPLADMAAQLGENWVTGTVLHTSVGGTYGPRLVLQDSVSVTWANTLDRAPTTAFVLVENGAHLRPWGPLPHALLYLSLTEVAHGQFQQAEQHLHRAAVLSSEQMPFYFDPEFMLVSGAALQLQADRFRKYLAEAGTEQPADETSPEMAGSRAALRSIFDELMASCGEDPGPGQNPG